jgi:hypothetical protein
MLCFQNQNDNLKKGNVDTADIYDIKSCLVQYPLLQEGAKGELLICIIFIIYILLINSVLR